MFAKESFVLVISYSTVVLYIGIMEVRDSWHKMSLQNKLNIYFMTLWLGIAKPKNISRSP